MAITDCSFPTASVNVNTSRSVTWTVKLPATEVDIVTNWVFRFLPADVNPNQTSYEISSASFVVKQAIVASVASTTSSISIASSSANPASGTMTGSTGTPSGSSVVTSSTHTGLSAGAIAGIAIGAVIVIAVVAGATWFFARRKPANPQGNQPMYATTGGAFHSNEKEPTNSAQRVPPYSQQQPQQSEAYYEFDGTQSRQQHVPYELGNNYVRQ